VFRKQRAKGEAAFHERTRKREGTFLECKQKDILMKGEEREVFSTGLE